MKYTRWSHWPLFLHSRYLARDLDALRETINTQMVDIDVKCLGHEQDDMGYMGHVKFADFEVGFIRYGINVQVLCKLDHFYTFVLPYSGKARLYHKYHPKEQSGYTIFLPPGEDLDMLYSGSCGHLVVRFAKSELIDSLLADIFYDWTLQSIELQKKLRAVCDRFLVDYTLTANYESCLGLIQSFKSDFLDTILLHGQLQLAVQQRNPDDDVKMVMTFIDNHPEWEYKIEDLQALNTTSLRTLYWKFNQQLGISPYRYYLNQKLMQVRMAMLTSDTAEFSVSEQALNKGFNHLSRFSQQYRQLFGELPKDTLKNLRFVYGHKKYLKPKIEHS